VRRIAITPRENWHQIVAGEGLTFHSTSEGIYWNESAYYEFSSSEIDELELATNTLHTLCLHAVQHVIDQKSYERFKIPSYAIPAIEWSWENEPPTLYGRFDLVYDGNSAPKMLEYNADTPTSLLEAAVIQWKWLDALYPEKDQFNSIWEGLVEQWKWLVAHKKLNGSHLHFAFSETEEDEMTVTMLRDTAQEAGLTTKALPIDQIGWNSVKNNFVDQNGLPIRSIFKLYPWEWMVREPFGRRALLNLPETQWIEPAWKMLVSNKAILAVLWELFPDSPYLVPAYFSPDIFGEKDYVKKPILGREGANVTIVRGDSIESSEGLYGEEGFIYQQFIPVPNFDGNHPIIGSWVVGETAQGIGIRETDGIITDNLARFVPHLF
jgi:glutathionylspermidine synthase